MCTSYETNEYRKFEAFTIFSRPNFIFRPEIYKDYPGAIVRRSADGWSTDPATFGMVPRERIPTNVKPYDTMNARVEIIAEKRRRKLLTWASRTSRWMSKELSRAASRAIQ